jgi:hypothetical protein
MGIQINLRIQQCSDKFFEIGCRMPAQQLVDEELARDAVNNVPPPASFYPRAASSLPTSYPTPTAD